MGDRDKALAGARKDPGKRSDEDNRHINECRDILAVKNELFRTEQRVKVYGEK